MSWDGNTACLPKVLLVFSSGMKTNLKEKFNKTKAKKKLDQLFSLHIRSYGKCELYGIGGIKCSNQLQTMHVVGRANLRLRWDDNNVFCGCSGHHTWYTFHPEKFWEMVQEYFPSKFKYITEHRNEKIKANQVFYEEMMAKFAS